MTTIEPSGTSGSTNSIRIDVGPSNVDVQKSKKRKNVLEPVVLVIEKKMIGFLINSVLDKFIIV
jgi:hypothetical protein